MRLNDTEGKFEDKVAMITGTFPIDRDDMLDLIIDADGVATHSSGDLTTGFDLLIVGKRPGKKKLKAASELGIPIMSVDEFMDMVED